MRPYITARCQPFQRIVSLDLGRHSRRGPSPINISNVQRGTGTKHRGYLGPRQIQNFFPNVLRFEDPGGGSSGHRVYCVRDAHTRVAFLPDFPSQISSIFEIVYTKFIYICVCVCVYFSKDFFESLFFLFLEIAVVIFKILSIIINYEMNMNLRFFRSHRVDL